MPRTFRAKPKQTQSRQSKRLYRRRGRYNLYRKAGINKTGYVKLIRKVAPIFVQNSGVGTAQLYIQDPGTGAISAYTSDLIQLGTPAVGISGAYDLPFSIKFRMSDLVNSSELTTLSDKYRIKGAYVRLIPSFTEHLMSSIYTRTYVEYFTDHDDASPPSLAQLRERMGMKCKTFVNGRYVGIKCNPSVNTTVVKNATAGTSSSAPKWGQWIDNSDNATDHFGIKGVFRGYNLVAPTSLKESIMFDIALVVELKDFQ